MEEIERFDKLKTKVLKYIIYKKRTKQEIMQKFNEEETSLLDYVIKELENLRIY